MTRLTQFLHLASVWLFWPALLLVTWGELTPNPPQLAGPLLWDKAQHFTAYFGLGSMTVMALGLRRETAAAVACLIAYSGLLEFLQGFTGRDPELDDFIANSIGAFSGVAVALFLLVLAGGLVGRAPRH